MRLKRRIQTDEDLAWAFKKLNNSLMLSEMRSKRLNQTDKDFIRNYKDKLSLDELSYCSGVDKDVISKYIAKITPPPPKPEKVIIRPKEKTFERPAAVYSNTNWNEYEP